MKAEFGHQLFAKQRQHPTCTERDPFRVDSYAHLRLLQSDLFTLTPELLCPSTFQ